MLVEKLPVFIQSGDLEVQERACCILQVSDVLQPLFPKGYNLTALVSNGLQPGLPLFLKGYNLGCPCF